MVYTPAISDDDIIFKFFRNSNFVMIKRSDLLASIVNDNFLLQLLELMAKLITVFVTYNELFKIKLHCFYWRFQIIIIQT